MSQESSASKSLGAEDFSLEVSGQFTARTRGGWIPVTSTGMRDLFSPPRRDRWPSAARRRR
ncbi:hypothetical protein GFL91_21295 [Rhizobium leguminosarum bv. viciae]|uniref:Uncharacterized protein n=1 Tax=Rhizobium leguminosarum bv. viciae TaxID=387 RepID=A0A8I2KKE6_RHILV|nr:hypothetical protein [Rhizobium leguminosarum bv. viciae]TBY80057.1 hypothetical protein E0H51_01855 [Rhizobium leguminosarum bv. viciae]TBY86170.1 hypothetical protein E0H32_02995 [Rhizobium leguminosarum bv. viciae]TBZ19507.1 hypothetical protein E0H33_05335 [Rhizobium leguminosarum bv. viciae]TCA10018.1 hypothetical protein E0H57_04065 [Rhizobium leguminosarum bv. viciae]